MKKIILLLMIMTCVGFAQEKVNIKNSFTSIFETLESISVGAVPDSVIYTSELDSGLALKQDVMGGNENYVTDAQLTVIGNTSGTNTGDNATNTQYSGLASSKQDALVSGTNIKTINSNSILGSGNLTIEAADTSIIEDLIETKLDTMVSNTLDFTATQINALLDMLNSIPSDSTTVGSGKIYFNTSDGIIRRKY